jgi:hypothetical protein
LPIALAPKGKVFSLFICAMSAWIWSSCC